MVKILYNGTTGQVGRAISNSSTQSSQEWIGISSSECNLLDLDSITQLFDQHQPDYVLVELGANDGLRGFPPNVITNNLKNIIAMSEDSGAEVALMQIQVPPNYGKKYTQVFADIYPALASEYQVPLLPFFLEQVIVKPEWMMQDGLHPKPEAQPWIAQFVAEKLAPYLTK